MSEYITKGIQAEILKKLPIEPLLRFRLVSKPWKCFIDSPDFIVSYGVRHPRPHRFILSYEDSDLPNECRHFRFFYDDYDDDSSAAAAAAADDDSSDADNDSSVDDDDYDDIDFDDDLPYDNLLLSRDNHPCLVGSSHGLLCFKKFYDELMYDFSWLTSSLDVVVLWNPSIRKSVRIPVPSMYDSPNKNYKAVNAFGFGVCPLTFDPTILKMKWMDKPGISPWKVRVFTLSTRTWNILSTNLPGESVILKGSQVVIDRFIYWLAFDRLAAEDGRSQSPFLIMSFDLTAKEFKEINLTGCLTNPLCTIETISKLRESLVLLEYHTEFKGDQSVCCLWMMTKEQGVNRSFTKLYNINVPHAKVKKLLGFKKSGKLILVTEHRELEIYDPNTEAIVNLDIHGYDDDSSIICSYMQSLLLLDQLDDFIYSIST